MNVGIYVRVSTADQAEHGYSLPTQLEACHQKAIEIGASNITEYIDDGYSGENMDRPDLERLRNDLKLGLIQTVICYDPDRLARNLSHQLVVSEEIYKVGELHFVSATFEKSPEGKLFYSIRGAISEFEKEKIKERSIRGKHGKAQQGRIIQNARPFGFDWDSQTSLYTINEKEAETVRLIYSLCTDHQMGVHSIFLELKRLDLRGKTGKFLHPKTIYNILTKRMYSGAYEQFREITKKTGQKSREIKKNQPDKKVIISIPAIVPQETFDQAQEQLQRNKTLAKRNTKNDYLLRGVLFCPSCGLKLIGTHLVGPRKRKPEKIYHYYFCVSQISSAYRPEKCCGALRIPAPDLDNAIWGMLLDIASGNVELANYLQRQSLPDHSQEIANFSKLKVDLEKKKETIVGWYKDNVLTKEQADKELRDINKELQQLTYRLATMEQAQKKRPLSSLPVAEILNATTFAERRAIVTGLGLKFFAEKNEQDVVNFWFE